MFESATNNSPPIWYCKSCFEIHGIRKYNPFLEVLSSGLESEGDLSNDLTSLSGVLENCNVFESPNTFNSRLNSESTDINSIFSIFYNNLDGNYSNFDNSNLAKVNFEGANLYSSSFKGANLFETNMRGANITGAIFDEANLSNAFWVDGKKCALGSVGTCD